MMETMFIFYADATAIAFCWLQQSCDLFYTDTETDNEWG